MKLITSLTLPSVLFSITLNATSLQDSVKRTINTNPDILAEHFNKKSFRTNIDEQKMDYRPTLDLITYVERSTTFNDSEDETREGSASKNGWNSSIEFEQVLYDGGLTPNEVDLYKFRYGNIKYTSNEVVEDLIHQIVNNYTRLVSYEELIELDKFKLEVHNKYLLQAKEKEEISGEILDSIQVSSKIKAVMDDYLSQEVVQQKAFSTYKKLSGNDLVGNVCRPVINENLIPFNVKEAIKISLRNSNRIKAQRATLREQQARVRVEDAKMRPNLLFQANAEFDNDLKLPENGQQDIYRLRVESTWNLYNGGKDTVTKQREKIIILQQRKILEAIETEVIDETKGSYNTYFKIKKRIKNIKAFNDDNKKIVDIYTKQMEDGSRTFLDLLNAEAELFRTKILLIQTEFSLYDEYYNILRSMNILSDTILNDQNQNCKKYVLDTSSFITVKDAPKSEADLEDELGLD